MVTGRETKRGEERWPAVVVGPNLEPGYIFSPYCTLFADNHERRSVLGRQGDGYFSGWKIIWRLPQALKWAALRLRTIIIISSDEEGAAAVVEEGEHE